MNVRQQKYRRFQQLHPLLCRNVCTHRVQKTGRKFVSNLQCYSKKKIIGFRFFVETVYIGNNTAVYFNQNQKYNEEQYNYGNSSVFSTQDTNQSTE